MLHKFVVITIIILIIVAALLYSPSKNKADDSWLTFDNLSAGVAFQYPAKWGQASFDEKGGIIEFLENPHISIDFSAAQNQKPECKNPKIIENDQYCKVFSNGNDYMYEFVVLKNGMLSQFARVKDIEILQTFDKSAPLENILSGSADKEILQKITDFENMIVSVETK